MDTVGNGKINSSINFFDTTVAFGFTKYAKDSPYEQIDVLLENIKQRAPKDAQGEYIESFVNGNCKNVKFKRKPLVYSLFGTFDLLVIYEIISLSFINKVLVNSKYDVNDNNKSNLKTNNDLIYQGNIHLLSGFTVKPNEKTDIILGVEVENKLFVGITEFKINNAYIISGGITFLNDIVLDLQKKLENETYIITYSLSSYELIVTIFGDDIKIMNCKLMEIRDLCFDQINITDKKKSLQFYEKIKCSDKDKHNIFSDTQTSYGIRLEKKGSTYNFSEAFKKHDINIECEFKIKPSQFKEFFENICDIKGVEKDNIRDCLKKVRFLPGKTDYKFTETFNADEYEKIFNKYNSDIEFSMITRSIFSLINFEIPETYLKNDRTLITKNEQHHKDLSFNIAKLDTIDDDLKLIGVNEQIRYRIIKMFQLYNTGINNTVTFSLYIDMYPFFKKLINDINVIKNKEDNLTSSKIQFFFTDIIIKFERAYHARLMNNYSFDEGNEIFINYNSSIQNYVSEIDTLMKLSINDLLSNYFGIKDVSSHVISIIDQTQTLSDRYFCNFDMTSTLHPGLLFNFITKEVLVIISKYDCFNNKFEQYSKNLFNKWLTYISPKLQKDWFVRRYKEHFVIEGATIKYFILDLMRYYIFFKKGNSDVNSFSRFNFWHNATILQNSINYDQNGRLSEYEFGLEIARSSFIYIIDEIENDRLPTYQNFLLLNPFNREAHRELYIGWIKMAKNIFDLVFNFIYWEEEKRYAVGITETISVLIKFSTKKSESDLFDHIYSYFNGAQHFFNDSLKIKIGDGKTIKNYLFNSIISDGPINENCLVCDTQGGFWFKDISAQLRYNEMNFKVFNEIADICYKTKFELFCNFLDNKELKFD
jgi:hypothetical protein